MILRNANAIWQWVHSVRTGCCQEALDSGKRTGGCFLPAALLAYMYCRRHACDVTLATEVTHETTTGLFTSLLHPRFWWKPEMVWDKFLITWMLTLYLEEKQFCNLLWREGVLWHRADRDFHHLSLSALPPPQQMTLSSLHGWTWCACYNGDCSLNERNWPQTKENIQHYKISKFHFIICLLKENTELGKYGP